MCFASTNQLQQEDPKTVHIISNLVKGLIYTSMTEFWPQNIIVVERIYCNESGLPIFLSGTEYLSLFWEATDISRINFFFLSSKQFLINLRSYQAILLSMFLTYDRTNYVLQHLRAAHEYKLWHNFQSVRLDAYVNQTTWYENQNPTHTTSINVNKSIKL